MFLSRAWQTCVHPLQVAAAHDTMLVPATTVSVHDTRSSKRVHLLVKQARKHWMERQVKEVNVAAQSGNLKPLYQFHKNAKNPKLPCRSSCHPELLRLRHKRWPLCGGITLPRILTTVTERFPLRIWQTPCKKSGLKFRLVTPARTHLWHRLVTPCRKSGRHQGGQDSTGRGPCDPVAQVGPCFLDWVDGRALTGRRYRTFWQGNRCRFYPSGGVPCGR